MADSITVVLTPGNTILSSQGSNTAVAVTLGSPVVIEANVGTTGPRGDIGPIGPIGPAVTTFIYTPPEPLTTWTVTHNMDRFPSVTVVDGAGEVVHAVVDYISSNTLSIYFVYPSTGYAYLN